MTTNNNNRGTSDVSILAVSLHNTPFQYLWLHRVHQM